jgi:preprotein translocase subunit SecA
LLGTLSDSFLSLQEKEKNYNSDILDVFKNDYTFDLNRLNDFLIQTLKENDLQETKEVKAAVTLCNEYFFDPYQV